MQLTESTTKSTHMETNQRRISIGHVAVGLSLIAIISKLFGFAEKLVVAHYFGTGDQADVYFATMGIVLSMYFLVKELIYPSVLPVFAETLRVSFSASASLFKKLFVWIAAIIALCALAMMFATDTVTALFMPGFTEEKRQLASSMLKYLSPAMLLLCLSSFTYAILNCRKQFFTAALPEAGLKLAVAAGLLVLAPSLGLHALAFVLTGAALAVVTIQLLFIPEATQLFKPSCGETNPAFHRILQLMSPLVLGVVFSHASGLVDTILASKLPSGHLAYLGYSKKLTDAILLVGPVALVTVLYTQLSHIASTSSKETFARLFEKAFRLILFVGIPTSVLLVSLRQPIVKILFERGQFTVESTLGTSNALLIYGMGLVTFSVEALVVYSFFARSNTRTPVCAGIAGVLLDIILAVTLVSSFGFRAIAWALVISKSAKVLALLILMNRDIRFIKGREFTFFLGKLFLATLPAAYMLKHLRFANIKPSLMNQSLFGLAIPSIGFLMVFLGCCYILRLPELRQLPAMILSKRPKQNENGGGS